MKKSMFGACALLALMGAVACSASESASNEKLGVSAAALGVDGGVDGGADAGDVIVVDAGDAGDAGQ
jgi:hypothetical protein